VKGSIEEHRAPYENTHAGKRPRIPEKLVRETGRELAESTGDLRGNVENARPGTAIQPSRAVYCAVWTVGAVMDSTAAPIAEGSLGSLSALETVSADNFRGCARSESVLSVLNPSAEVLTRDIRTEAGP